MKAIDAELTSFNEVKNKRIKELGEEVKNEKGDPTGNFQVSKKKILVFLLTKPKFGKQFYTGIGPSQTGVWEAGKRF